MSTQSTDPNNATDPNTGTDLTGSTALVTGAGRGFGRAVALALRDAGAHVVAVSRTAASLEDLGDLGDGMTTVVADATDPVVAASLLDRHRPRTLILNAGARPLPRPLQLQTWESFSRPWDVDARQAFFWLRESLLLPLDPGSIVVTVSSGAALFGSPLSGGYAGAKAAVRFATQYAAEESERAGLGIRYVSVLPKLSAGTELGGAAAEAYAARAGMGLEDYLAQLGPGPTPEQVGKTLTGLVTTRDALDRAYVLGPEGLLPTP